MATIINIYYTYSNTWVIDMLNLDMSHLDIKLYLDIGLFLSGIYFMLVLLVDDLFSIHEKYYISILVHTIFIVTIILFWPLVLALLISIYMTDCEDDYE